MLKYTLVMQLADLMDDQAQEISEKTPEMTENLQQKAEEQAGKVSEKAKPAADQASSAIEGGAKRVAEGGPQSSLSAPEWTSYICILSCFHLDIHSLSQSLTICLTFFPLAGFPVAYATQRPSCGQRSSLSSF